MPEPARLCKLLRVCVFLRTHTIVFLTFRSITAPYHPFKDVHRIQMWLCVCMHFFHSVHFGPQYAFFQPIFITQLVCYNKFLILLVSKKETTRSSTGTSFVKQHDTTPTLDILSECEEGLRSRVAKATKIIQSDPSLPPLDSRLSNLIQARDSLKNRLIRHKHSRGLRRKIAYINQEIENHASRLVSENWYSLCDSLNHTFSTKRTWNISRHLLDPTSTKSSHNHTVSLLIHNYPRMRHALITYLDKYIPQGPPTEHPPHTGEANAALDAPFTEAEFKAAIYKLNIRSVPGPDQITNKILRQLYDSSITGITALFKECWTQGKIPEKWRTAKTILIWKPGKPPHIDHLRPISLTSCLGKLLVHVVLTRLTEHAEDTQLFPHTMLGFRPRLCTQDLMLQLQHPILDSAYAPKHTTEVILGLDISKAFDSVRHSAILNGEQEWLWRAHV